jgi:predicted phage gp36 major capsid-like protein
MCVDERSQVPLCVLPGTRQLFGEVGFARGVLFFAAKRYRVGGDVCDVNAVRSSVAPLVDTAALA